MLHIRTGLDNSGEISKKENKVRTNSRLNVTKYRTISTTKDIELRGIDAHDEY